MKGMSRLFSAVFLLFIASSVCWSQTPADVLTQVRKITLLKSTRAETKRILGKYDSTDDDGHYQEFSSDNVTIEVTYASGVCSDDSEDEDASEVWSVPEWTVTRIEISLDQPIKAMDVGLDPTKFRKELRFPDDSDSHVFYDKSSGFAFKTTEEGIEKFILFPSRTNRSKLCRASTAAKGFYARNGWFSQARPYDYVCILVNLFANVEDVKLSALEIDASSAKTISVLTTAIDPENDVLTYNYKVSAGRIIGRGWEVTWDLTDVAPGTYSITVGVDDGAGVVGKTVTKTVVVK